MLAHDTLKKYFNTLESLLTRELGTPEDVLLPFQKDSHEWKNLFYKSPIFRHIHLEFYKTEKICVLHSNFFPISGIDIPILGFDMIALGDKITGLFFDYSPLVTTRARLEYDLDILNSNFKSPKRTLPEWANFFSKDFYCVTPIAGELDDILKVVINSFVNYLDLIKYETLRYSMCVEKQNIYCKNQKLNDKTFKALSSEIGEDNARLFLNKYLFPEIEIN